MITSIIPKLPMRNKAITKNYYCNELGFNEFANVDFADYLMLYRGSLNSSIISKELFPIDF